MQKTFRPAIASRRAPAIVGATFAIAATVVALAGCSAAEPTATEPETITIGLSQPTAAAVGAFGVAAVNGAQLAVDEINEAGGIDGKQIELLVEDNACNATDGATAAEKLIEDGAIALIGALCSDATLPVLSIAERSEVPLLVDLASNPAITEETGEDGNNWVFRWAPSDSVTAATAIDSLASLGGFETIAVIADDGSFGQGGAEAIEAAAGENGIEVLSTDLVNLDSPDYSSIIARVALAQPDAVVLWLNSSTTIASFYEAYATSSLKDVPLAGQLDMTQPAIAANGLSGYNSASYSADVDTEENVAYLAAWEAAGYDLANAYVGWDGYQSIQILAAAIADAEELTSTGIRDALKGLTYSPMIIGGSISFDEKNQAHPSVVIEKFTGADVEATVFSQD
jgi:branched-chain amino acid transport system substrate-binding protein